jgi:predicted outer membrane protein
MDSLPTPPRTTSRRRHLALSFCALILLAAATTAARAAAPESASASAEFATAAARSGVALLQSARIAQKASRDESVRAFASSIAVDYTQANDALAELCRRKNIPIPLESDGADFLPDTAGATFDRVYSLDVAQQLAKADALFAAASRSERLDTELRGFARQRLGAVREQAKRADILAKSQAGVSTREPARPGN